MMNLTPEQAEILETLFATILNRQNQVTGADTGPSTPEKRLSYTQTLLKKGLVAINAKVDEEAHETIEAATILDQLKNRLAQHNNPSKSEPKSDTDTLHSAQAHLIHELADVVYHLFVLAAYSNVHLDDIKKELYKRHKA